MEAGQHDGTEPGTATMLYAGAILGVLLRATTWVLSAFTIGPVLGLIDTIAVPFATSREILFLQAVVTIATVVAAVLGGLGLQMDPARYRLPVRLLCATVILDALIYLTPIVWAATLAVGLTGVAWAVFAVAVVGNLGLAGLALLVIARTGRPRAGRQQPAAATLG